MISTVFFMFCAKSAGALRFSRPFGNLSIFVFIAVVLDFLFSFTEMKANTVYARAQAAILRSSGHSAGAPNENIVQNHLIIALLNVFSYLNGRYRHIFIP